MNTTMHRRTLRSSQGGFSLIEIMIVVTLIGGIMALVATQVFKSKDQANFKLAKTQVSMLAGKVDQFEMDTGSLPGRLEDLVKEPGNAKGWLGPYAKAGDFKDPWNTPIEYRVPGEGAPFTLISYGADRKPGGSGIDADPSSDD